MTSRLNLNTATDHAKAGTTYVVMSADRSTIVRDPGQDKPWSTKIKLRAEEVAKECGGVVETLKDALTYVMKHPKNAGGKN